MEDTLFLGAYDEMYIIDLKQLMYFQADDHYTNVYYATGTHFIVPFGLSKVEAIIAKTPSVSGVLLRLGRKYIVNTRRIFRVSTVKEMLYLADNHGNNISLHISKPVLRSLIDQFKANLSV